MTQDILSDGKSQKIAIGVICCIVVIFTSVLLGGDLVYHHYQTNKNKSKKKQTNVSILKWQILSWTSYSLACVMFGFLRCNVIYGGTNSDYDPLVLAPYAWGFFLLFNYGGKVCTDVSWMIRVYTTFKV